MRIKLSTLRTIISEALENAYDVLGVQPGASKKEILAAWRKLVYDARASRGGGRGGHEATLINYYTRAVKAAIANAENPDIPPTFEPRAVRPHTGADAPEDQSWENWAENGGGALPDEQAAATGDPMAPGAKRTRKPQRNYKTYGTKDGKTVIRVGGQLYGTGAGGDIGDGQKTRFTKNDRVNVTFDPEADGRVTVGKGDDYTQTWNTVDEVRQAVDRLIIESFSSKR